MTINKITFIELNLNIAKGASDAIAICIDTVHTGGTSTATTGNFGEIRGPYHWLDFVQKVENIFSNIKTH